MSAKRVNDLGMCDPPFLTGQTIVHVQQAAFEDRSLPVPRTDRTLKARVQAFLSLCAECRHFPNPPWPQLDGVHFIRSAVVRWIVRISSSEGELAWLRLQSRPNMLTSFVHRALLAGNHASTGIASGFETLLRHVTWAD